MLFVWGQAKPFTAVLGSQHRTHFQGSDGTANWATKESRGLQRDRNVEALTLPFPRAYATCTVEPVNPFLALVLAARDVLPSCSASGPLFYQAECSSTFLRKRLPCPVSADAVTRQVIRLHCARVLVTPGESLVDGMPSVR